MDAKLSALNNSSLRPDMGLEEILAEADRRVAQWNQERETPLAEARLDSNRRWDALLAAARRDLPDPIKPFVRAARRTQREDQPNEIAVAIELPEAERIFFGPWIWSEERQEFEVAEPWRNKPFQVAGGNMEEFGDLLDAIARAREVYRISRAGTF